MVKQLLVWLCLCALPCAALARIDSQVDQARLYQQQSVLLTITIDEPLEVGALDIRPLFQNFVVGELRFAQRSQNGRTLSQWQIPLLPLTTGPQQIPPLRVAGKPSPAVALVVQPGRPPETTPQLLAVKLDQQRLFPGQAALYQLQLTQPVGIQIDSVPPPTLDGARIRQIGDDRLDETIAGGKRIRLLHRTYAITHATPGTFQLQGPLVQGLTLGSNVHRPFLQQGQPLSLQIMSLPGGIKPELVSQNVQLEAHWQTGTKPHRVGDPLVRLLTIRAFGNTLEQLPPMVLPELTGVRSYADGKSQSETIRQGQLVAEQTLRQAFIPQQAGPLTLPPITLHWWNSQRQRMESTRLDTPPLTIEAAMTPVNQPLPSPAADENGLPWLTLGFALAWVVTLLFWWRTGHRLPRLPRLHRLSDRWSWRQLKRALDTQDPQQIHRALLHWGRQRWPQLQPTCLEALPCYPDLRAELDPLLAACFCEQPSVWSATRLRRGLSRWREKHPKVVHPLNPDGLI